MVKIAFAGQPNCGKSTIFNMISGVNQHIANYPGVTVDKKSAKFTYEKQTIEFVDLPGTYSFSSYSLEERVAKQAILSEKPDVILNVVDGSNLKRSLYLTFQLLEMGLPIVVVLNMMDVAKTKGLTIDSEKISKMLGVPVIEAVGSKGKGGKKIMDALLEVHNNKGKYQDFELNYEKAEPEIAAIKEAISDVDLNISKRWLAVKIFEGDQTIADTLEEKVIGITELGKEKNNKFKEITGQDSESYFATLRYDSSSLIISKCVQEERLGKESLTDKIDKIVLNRLLALPILLLIMLSVYELSIVMGYKLTDYTWPILAAFKNLVISILPAPDYTEVPMITELGIWLVNSANALLNYIPIFLILFALIAILEDVGYMPRMAFILDRIFRKFGLHGQSTLPLVLGGAFVGGCAVPGVMATKGIADDRARMATILTVPLMNCLAKVPFYTLLLGAFFKPDMALMMFFISTITVLIALIIAKIVTSTFLKTRETAPFVMEMPVYHLPTAKGVILRAFQRVWLYIKKVATIVMAVAIVLFAMLQFPGIDDERQKYYDSKSQQALETFFKKAKNSKYYSDVDSKEEVSQLLNYYDSYRSEKMSVTSKEAGKRIDEEFLLRNIEFFKFIKPKKDKEARKINKLLRKISKQRKRILREIKNEKIENSLLGMAGKAVEPITQYAGFDWKINVSFLSSFAARESAVATLGSIYENNKTGQRAEDAMRDNSGYTPLHATAIIIFMLLTPPCIATMIVVKMETHSYRWMFFAIFFPIALGIIFASIVFTMGQNYGWSGVDAMTYFYGVVLAITLLLGLFPSKMINWRRN
ncbi:MAG: ferrous iron transport protein B [Campylobacterales bacterium]|nr:ferrous iron transport protein B [Campylobacterales bacterium]